MKDNPGYSINMIRLLIGQCAQAWNLQSSPPLKSRGVGGNSGLQAKPFYFPKDSNHKPQASSSRIEEPGKSFTHLWSRASTKIKVLFGCFTWKLIWCGENVTLLLFVTFSSIVKKWPLALLTSKSGVPCKLLFSSRISEKSLKLFLTFWYNLRSGPIHFWG